MYQRNETNNTLDGKKQSSVTQINTSKPSSDASVVAEGGHLGNNRKSHSAISTSGNAIMDAVGIRLRNYILQDQSVTFLQGYKRDSYTFIKTLKSLKKIQGFFKETYSFRTQPKAPVFKKKTIALDSVRKCLRYRISKNEKIKVMYNVERMNAQYAGLQRCGNLWTCPICAARISEHRRQQLAQAHSNWTSGADLTEDQKKQIKLNVYDRLCEINNSRLKNDDYKNLISNDKESIGILRSTVQIPEFSGKGYIYFLTLTNPHTVDTSLQLLASRQTKAMKHFYGDRRGRLLLDALGRIGQITNYEITYGANGWHPHHHILLFSTKKVNFNSIFEYVIDEKGNRKSVSISKALKDHWISCCEKASLPLPSVQNGLTIQTGDYAHNYISKWGITSEMTKGHVSKHGKTIKATGEKGYTTFELLRLASEGHETIKTSSFVGGKLYTKERTIKSLFREFAFAFYGKQQLVWSRKLYKTIMFDQDITDDEIINQTDKMSIEAYILEHYAFSLLVKYNRRADFLTAVENDQKNDTNEADQLLAELNLLEYPIYEEEILPQQEQNSEALIALDKSNQARKDKEIPLLFTNKEIEDARKIGSIFTLTHTQLADTSGLTEMQLKIIAEHQAFLLTGETTSLSALS